MVNKGIRPANQKFSYTEEHIKEIYKCKMSIEYFAENYIYIIHPSKGKIKIELYDFQKPLLNNFKNHPRNVVLSSRQSSKSTTCCIFILWYSIFHRDKTCAILANVDRTSMNLLTDLKNMLEELPDWLKPGCSVYNAHTIEFDNGTKIFSAATSKNALRGESISVLMLDELAFVEPNLCESFFTSNMPTVDQGEHILIVSTPNGIGGIYHKIWTDAVNKRNSFVANRIDWWQVPGRDEEWAKRMKADLGEVRFAAEYGNQFIGSQTTLISSEMLKELKAIDPIYKEDIRGGCIKYWEEYDPRCQYVASIDVSVGTGSDYSIMQIYRVDYHEPRAEEVIEYRNRGEDEPAVLIDKVTQVFVYRNNLTNIPDFARYCYRELEKWGNPAMILENNGVGQSFSDISREQYYYENAYSDAGNYAIGVNSNVGTKNKMITILKKYCERDKVVIRDTDLINEMMTFVEKTTTSGNRRFEADAGNHDDLIMSLGWLCYLVDSVWYQDFLTY